MRLWQSSTFLWVALLGGALTWRLIFFVGAQGSDDLAYSEAAWTVASGGLPIDRGIHGCRIGYVGIIGAFYAIFGAGTFSLVLLNLIASVADVALARVVAREFLDDSGAWLAAALVAVLPVHVFYATEAHPDVPAAALGSLSAWIFLVALKTNRPSLFVLSGFALGAAHLMKETAFVGIAGLAALGGRPRPRFLLCLAGFFAVVAAESVFFWSATGNPFYRFHSVGSMQASIMNSDFYLSTSPTYGRLVDVPGMLLWPGHGQYPFFGILPLLALIGAGFAIRRGQKLPRGPLGWTASVAFLLIFWPISLLPYRPAMVIFPRIFLAIAIPLSVLAAFFLRHVSVASRRIVLALTFLASAGGIMILHEDGRRESSGARMAYPLTVDLPVVSDPRTIQFLRLYDGYSSRRQLLAWNQPDPPGPHYRVVNTTWIRHLQYWNGIQAPSNFEPPGVAPLRTEHIEGRLRLRPLLSGHLEHSNPEELTVYRIP